MTQQVKPGYKMTETGELPIDWEVKSISQVGKVVRGGSPRPAGDPKYFNGSYIPWLTVAALTNIPASQIEVMQTDSFLTAEGSLHSRRLSAGTLIIANSGATLGVAKILGIECCANDGIAAILDIDKGISAQYLTHFINTKTSYLRDIVATGNGQPNLNTELIGKFNIPLPPTLAEQEAIAGALSDADGLIESLEQLVAKKRRIKQGAMQELLTGQKRLPGFAEEWHVKRFGDLFIMLRNASNSRSELSENGDVAYIHYGDIHTHPTAFLDEANLTTYIPREKVSSVPRLADGDLLMVDASEDTTAIGKAVEITGLGEREAVGGLHTMVLRGDKRRLANGFKGYLQYLPAVRLALVRLATGVSVYGITKSGVKAIEVKLPALVEQSAIAAILSDMDAEIAGLEAKLSKARQVKQGMMQELLTGRIRLVQPHSTIMPFPEKQQGSNAKAKGHNEQFNEAVVLAVLSNRFGSEQYPLGRLRRTKLSYLLHRNVERVAEGFQKKAAGPYNPQTRYGGAEKIALKNGYVLERSNDKYGGFVAAEKIAEAESYFEKWYGTDVLDWLEQFRFKKNDDLELLTTVDMAMEDLCREAKPATLASVTQIIRDHPEWKAKLERAVFSDANIQQAMLTCSQLFNAMGNEQ